MVPDSWVSDTEVSWAAADSGVCSSRHSTGRMSQVWCETTRRNLHSLVSLYPAFFPCVIRKLLGFKYNNSWPMTLMDTIYAKCWLDHISDIVRQCDYISWCTRDSVCVSVCAPRCINLVGLYFGVLLKRLGNWAALRPHGIGMSEDSVFLPSPQHTFYSSLHTIAKYYFAIYVNGCRCILSCSLQMSVSVSHLTVWIIDVHACSVLVKSMKYKITAGNYLKGSYVDIALTKRSSINTRIIQAIPMLMP